MPEETNKTTYRLNKLTKEFGVGVQTIVDFLAKKGFEIKNSPSEKLNEELKAMRESEMWQAGATVRKLRPENN